MSETLGITIVNAETEVSVGGYKVDIKAETEDEKVVTIENQLETTNHTHMGQIITYASGLKANYIVWVVTKAREEHREALDWLNENTNEEINFFLVEIKVYKIGDSLPAPKFEIVCKPNDWQKIVKKIASGELAEREKLRLDFWQGFIDLPNSGFSHRKTNRNHWFLITLSNSIFNCCLVTNKMNPKGAAVEFIVPDLNKYEYIVEKKQEIEKLLGFKLQIIKRKETFLIVSSYKYSINDLNKWKDIYNWYLVTFEKMKIVIPEYFE